MLSRLGPILLIAVLGLTFFYPLVLHPGQILYSDYSDVLAEHLPAKTFLVRSVWETGEIPLWCPYIFGGAPFVHDIQVGIFYPPHAVLYLVGEAWVGVALSWLIVAHVILAGWTMYAYARSQRLCEMSPFAPRKDEEQRPFAERKTTFPAGTQGLGTPAALIAAIGYMFAGKWLLHLLAGGHYIVVGLAWLPLVVMCLENAIRRRSFFWATAAGIVFGVLALGTQPQWTFYAGLFIAPWTFAAAIYQPRARASAEGSLARARGWSVFAWAGFGAWTAVLAGGLAAIQFLPTFEAAGQSMRSAGMPLGDLWDGCLRSIQFFFGPALACPPGASSLQWEDRGGFGVLWVAAAALAPFLRAGKVRYQAGVAVVLIAFAWGGCLLFKDLPGFSFFRQHARMLMIVTFPVAYLAGVSTQALLTGEPTPLGRKVLIRVLIGAAILTVGSAFRIWWGGIPLLFQIYWPTLLVTVPLAFWLLSKKRPGWVWLWGTILLVDVWGIVWPWVQVKPEAEIYPRSACVEYLKEHAGLMRVLDRDAPGTATSTPLGTGAPLAMLDRIPAVRGYSPIDVLRYKEYLQFITDKDEPMRPLTPGNPLTFPVMGSFPVVNKNLLDLLGVEYLLQPSDVPPEHPEEWEKVFEDDSPAAFDFVLGGVRPLPPYAVYRNLKVVPRAFIVSMPGELPERSGVLERLRRKSASWTLLELPDEPTTRPSFPATWKLKPIDVVDYQPNRVRLETSEAYPRLIVLTDIWYPGWTCTVDGKVQELFRADFLFRAVIVPEGEHEVVFTFDPWSYRLGRVITLVSCGLAFWIGVLGLILWAFRRRKAVTS